MSEETMMNKSYRSLSGRRYDLDKLTIEEQGFLDRIFAIYRKRPPWNQFCGEWIRLGREHLWGKKVAVGSTPYRICQDLAAHLGIAEGRVAPPEGTEEGSTNG